MPANSCGRSADSWASGPTCRASAKTSPGAPSTCCSLSGLWRQAIDMLKDASGRAGHGLHSGSAATDLAVGLAYVYAGRGYMALDPLLAAIAQLEVRASLQSLRQAYAATAFAYAQTGNSVQATIYLDRARSADGPARFAVGSSTEFCMDMASRWLGRPGGQGPAGTVRGGTFPEGPLHPGRHLHARGHGQRNRQGFPVHGGTSPGCGRARWPRCPARSPSAAGRRTQRSCSKPPGRPRPSNSTPFRPGAPRSRSTSPRAPG